MAAGETAGKVTIDHHSPVRKHFQLREILLDMLEREFKVGDSSRASGSSAPVRPGADDRPEGAGPPRPEGRLTRVPGKGTFVAEPKIGCACG